MNLIDIWMLGLGGIVAGVTIGILLVRVRPHHTHRATSSTNHLTGEVI